MKKISDGTYLDEETEENEIVISSYWDIEDLLYEQYKEMKIEESLNEG